MIKKFNANNARLRRHQRIRHHLKGSTERPRLCVFRSGQHIYAQVIDDKKSAAKTPVEALAAIAHNRKVATAREVGKLVAQRAKEKGVSRVVFDRGGYAYHGRVAALAEGAREVGLDF